MNHRSACGFVAAAGLCLPLTAQAQSGADFAVRRDLLEQAQRAHDAHDETRALELATRAGQLQMTPSVRMFIAQEQFALSRFADALNDAELCVREAQSASVANHDAIRVACVDLANQSRGRVGRVVVHVPTPAVPGLEVRVNAHEVPAALIGFPYIVTPGVVVVEAVAPGHEVRRVEVTVLQGANVDVEVVPGAAIVVSAAPLAPPPPRAWTTHRVRPIAGPAVLVAGGAVSLGAAIVFGVLRGSAVSTLNGLCDTPDAMGTRQCDASARGSFNDATTDSIAADVALGVGVVAVVAGAAWFLAGGHDERVPQASLMVSPTVGGAMVGVGGVL